MLVILDDDDDDILNVWIKVLGFLPKGRIKKVNAAEMHLLRWSDKIGQT